MSYQRLHCPKHDEETPSLIVYEDHAYCYGGCGRIELNELGRFDLVKPVKRDPENLEQTLAYVRSLPLTEVRGLKLPADDKGYYLVWPGNDYYKLRRWIGGGGDKYYCPRGHKKPLYVPYVSKSHTLALVEGELNALSIAEHRPKFTVCSPGGVGDFKNLSIEYLKKTFTFNRCLLILDKDAPGLDAAIKMKEKLLKTTPYVQIVLMEKDANELLKDGKLEEEVRKWEMGL